MVILAKHAGFCFGVKRAVDAVQRHIGQRIVTLGPLIHNRDVVESLAAQGVRCVGSLDEVTAGETVVIRSHGAPPETYEALSRKGLEYIDATCPFVKRIHARVLEAKEAGQPVVIVGEAGHPEVDGTLGWAGGGAHAVYTPEDVDALPPVRQAVVVAQTTITEQKWRDMLSLLEQKIDRVIPFMSICVATQQRQSEAEQIARRADTIIVVGGRQSSNTRKLVELCARYCENIYHIEHKNELLLEKMRFGGIIGIVAGASTPDTMIREVFDYMIDNDKVLPLMDGEDVAALEAASDPADLNDADVSAAEVPALDTSEPKDEPAEQEPITEKPAAQGAAAEAAQQEQPAEQETAEPAEQETAEAAEPAEQETAEPAEQETAEAAEPAEQETAEAAEPAEQETGEKAEQATEDTGQSAGPATEQDEFLEGLEKVVRLKKGQLITGNIVQITDDDVCVNIGYKSDGIIHSNELSTHDTDPKSVFRIGDEIEAEVISLNDGEGNVLLSRKRIEKKQNWLKIQENIGTETLYKCTVKKAVKGGVTTRIEGYSAFIPASHLSLKYVEDLKEFEGKELEVTLIDADKKQERLVASHKSVLFREKKEKEKEIWEGFKKGEIIKGVVKRLTDFGAFVDVGGVDGLLHISDLAWMRVKHPSDIVSEGQELELLILSVDPAKKKIALGYKQLMAKPWDLVPEKYHVGDVVKGKVVRIVPFGAFVQLEPMIDGLVHISQITSHRIEKVEDALRLGDEVEAKVLDVSADKRKISLSIRALLPVEERPAEKKDEYAKEDNYHYEIPPVQESTVSLADFFPKKED